MQKFRHGILVNPMRVGVVPDRLVCSFVSHQHPGCFFHQHTGCFSTTILVASPPAFWLLFSILGASAPASWLLFPTSILVAFSTRTEFLLGFPFCRTCRSNHKCKHMPFWTCRRLMQLSLRTSCNVHYFAWRGIAARRISTI